jgi:hypothetical protein
MKSLALALVLLLSFQQIFAQDPCDDLAIVSIQYSPFTDTLILVEVTNASEELFSYPGFVLIDANGDTLAKEVVNYFGISGQSVHLLTVRPGVANPLDNFQGTLELHTGFFESFACSWPINQGLCASETCDDFVIKFENWGGALVLGDFEWSVTDSLGNQVAAGTLTMTAEEQYWSNTLCLTPNKYSYHLLALGEPSGGGPTMFVQSGEWFGHQSTSQYFSWKDGTTMQVPFYLHCIAQEPNAISETTNQSQPTIHQNGASTTVQSSATITALLLYASDGKLIERWNPNSTAFTLPTSLPAGLYVLYVNTASGNSALKVVVGQ